MRSDIFIPVCCTLRTMTAHYLIGCWTWSHGWSWRHLFCVPLLWSYTLFPHFHVYFRRKSLLISPRCGVGCDCLSPWGWRVFINTWKFLYRIFVTSLLLIYLLNLSFIYIILFMDVHLILWSLVLWCSVLIINLTQPRVTWKDRTSMGRFQWSDQPVAMPMGECMNKWLMWQNVQPAVCVSIPRQVGLGLLRQLMEYDPGNRRGRGRGSTSIPA